MQQPNQSRTRASLAAALAVALATPAAFAMDSGSTGADGAFSPTVSQTVTLPQSGILNYTTVNIPAGVTITFQKNTANTPVHILASGDVTIAGTIDIKGQHGKNVGTAGDGVLGDDGIPGESGPGGYSGGRGGREDTQQRAAIVRGGAGLGPGGGPGGNTAAVNCAAPDEGYYPYFGVGGAHVNTTYRAAAFYGSCNNGTNKARGLPYGSTLVQPLIGGSGGGGGRGGVIYPGSGGGGGGGAILIATSGKLTLTGTINANGGDGGNSSGETGSTAGTGAGGAGGAIRLMATTLAGSGGKLYVAGGCGYSSPTSRDCTSNGDWSSYGGSYGRVRVEGEIHQHSYTTSPAGIIVTDNQPGAVFIPNAPTLSIVSVGGQAVPANPTGTADLSFPASTSSAPVQITFQTTNVPDGNTVRLRVVPAYGATIEAITPGIASGNSAVSVTLPSGPSTLQATTTYTVVVAALEDAALAEKLSRLAQNEQVEKVEVTVALQGDATARLITGSGKVFDLPYQALSAIGFRG